MYRGHTVTLKRDAHAWAKQIEVQAEHIFASGYQPVPEGYGIGDLIDGYAQKCNMGGRTKPATLAVLKRELATIPLKRINGIHLRGFIHTRAQAGARGVSIATDLPFSGVSSGTGTRARWTCRLASPVMIAGTDPLEK